MSDSLRDQLLQAGFSKPEAEPPRQRKPARKRRPQAQNVTAKSGASQQRHGSDSRHAKQVAQDAAIAQRKALKSQIKELIESSAVKEYNGEIVYRFTLQNRIRELHISEEAHKRLVADELVITRLNGSTYLVPAQTAQAIKELNPEWAVVVPTEATSDASEEYAAFPIPDELQW